MSKKITEYDVSKVAELAHLAITKEEIHKFTHDLGSILEYMGKLEEIDVTQVEPMTHVQSHYGPAVGSGTNIFREDKVEPSLSVERALSGAPARNGPYFKTPLIRESES